MTNDAMIRLWLRYFKKVFISQRHIETLNRLKDVMFVKYFKIIQLGRRKQKTLADKMSLKKKNLVEAGGWPLQNSSDISLFLYNY